MKRIILAIPHIGTAYGHLIRTVEYLNAQYTKADQVWIILPKSCKSDKLSLIPSHFNKIYRNTNWSVTNHSGQLNYEIFLDLVSENIRVTKEVSPHLIIGDPGLLSAIVANQCNLPWIGLCHGCYLPKPNIPKTNKYHNLSCVIWDTINAYLDSLIEIGTKGLFSSWSAIQKTGEIVIPSNSIYEPSEIGTHFEGKTSDSWEYKKPVKTLVTCCSSEESLPDSYFLAQLTQNVQSLSVSCQPFKKMIDGVTFLGTNVHYSSLVDEETTVITHAGHGTLKSIRKAKRVFMVPGDLDQLCNSIIAHIQKGWDIVLDRDWEAFLKSDKLFVRKVYWDALKVYKDSCELIIKGYEAV